MSSGRAPFDMSAYAHRVATVDCFVCASLRGEPDFVHHSVYEDAEHVVLLNRFPTLRGQLHVALMAEHGVVRSTPADTAELASALRLAFPFSSGAPSG